MFRPLPSLSAMKNILIFSLVPALLGAIAFGSSANAADHTNLNGRWVYKCGGGDIYYCFAGGEPRDYSSADQGAADFYCHDRGGLANPPLVQEGLDRAEGDTIRDEQDEDIEETRPRR